MAKRKQGDEKRKQGAEEYAPLFDRASTAALERLAARFESDDPICQQDRQDAIEALRELIVRRMRSPDWWMHAYFELAETKDDGKESKGDEGRDLRASNRRGDQTPADDR